MGRITVEGGFFGVVSIPQASAPATQGNGATGDQLTNIIMIENERVGWGGAANFMGAGRGGSDSDSLNKGKIKITLLFIRKMDESGANLGQALSAYGCGV